MNRSDLHKLAKKIISQADDIRREDVSRFIKMVHSRKDSNNLFESAECIEQLELMRASIREAIQEHQIIIQDLLEMDTLSKLLVTQPQEFASPARSSSSISSSKSKSKQERLQINRLSDHMASEKVGNRQSPNKAFKRSQPILSDRIRSNAQESHIYPNHDELYAARGKSKANGFNEAEKASLKEKADEFKQAIVGKPFKIKSLKYMGGQKTPRGTVLKCLIGMTEKELRLGAVDLFIPEIRRQVHAALIKDGLYKEWDDEYAKHYQENFLPYYFSQTDSDYEEKGSDDSSSDDMRRREVKHGDKMLRKYNQN